MTTETDWPHPCWPDPVRPDQQEIVELKQRGWEADDITRGLDMPHQFESFSETLNYLVDLGDKAEKVGVMPSIHIDGGTRVNVRIGRRPSRGLTADEIRLAKALS